MTGSLTAQTKTKTAISKKRKIVKQKSTKKNMTKTPEIRVLTGNWGGTGISLTVEGAATNIQFDCAEAQITDKINLDTQGSFRAEGEYTRNSFGPIRSDNQPQPQPARFEGKIVGDTLTLNVFLKGNSEKLGEFQLKSGVTPRIRRCL